MNKNPFRYFKTSPEVIRLAVMMYVWFPLSLRNVEDLRHERGIDICMRRCGFGGTGLGQCSLPRSDGSELTAFVHGPNCDGTWTRCS